MPEQSDIHKSSILNLKLCAFCGYIKSDSHGNSVLIDGLSIRIGGQRLADNGLETAVFEHAAGICEFIDAAIDEHRMVVVILENLRQASEIVEDEKDQENEKKPEHQSCRCRQLDRTPEA